MVVVVVGGEGRGSFLGDLIDQLEDPRKLARSLGFWGHSMWGGMGVHVPCMSVNVVAFC